MWNPNPSNSIAFRADTYALYFDHDQDFPGWATVVMLRRASTAVEWQSFGTLLTGAWADDVSRKGGWDNWITQLINEANRMTHASLGDTSPITPVGELPAGVPADFWECKAWMLENVYAVDDGPKSNLYLGSKPQEPAEPVPDGFVANRVFDVGKQRLNLQLEVSGNGEAKIRFERQVGNGWQKVTIA